MWGLLVSTVLTSAADSLNPIAITQQFVLQGMVKKPRHIWYFIVPTGLTNLIGGFLAYYGLLAFVGGFFAALIETHRPVVLTGVLILGMALLVAAGYLSRSAKIAALRRQVRSLRAGDDNGGDEAAAARRIKSVSPAALVALGVGATSSELATALPYFAFLAILFNHQLSLLEVTLVLVIYNTIYTSPLMVLYAVYVKAQHKFDRLYHVIKTQIARWGHIVAPVVAGGIGAFLVYQAATGLWS